MKKSHTGSVILSLKSIQSRVLYQADFKTGLFSKFREKVKSFTGLGMFVIALFLSIFIVGKVNAQWVRQTVGDINTLFANGTTIIGGMNGSGGSIFLGTGSGTNWYSPATPGMTQGADVRAINANSNYVFVGSQSGLFRCVNDGNYSSWTNVLAGGYWSLLVNGPEIFAGTLGDGVWHSIDNGDKWTQSISGMEPYPHVYALASNGSHLFAGMYAGSGIVNSPDAGVYHSDDNGVSWTQKINGLTNRDVFALAVSGNYIFAGTNDGIFRSADNGENWTFLASGSVHSIKVVCETDIYIGLLNNGGVSRSFDNGATWTGYNTGAEWNTPAVMSLAVIGSDIFAGTLGQGTQKANIGDCPVVGTTCITWDLLADSLVTSSSGDLQGLPEVIGAGSGNPMSVWGHNTNGQELWCGFNGWQQGSLDIGRYIQFDVAPASGNDFTVNNISFDYSDFQNGVDMNTIAFRVGYSLDHWNTVTLLNQQPFTYLGTSVQTFTAAPNVVVPDGSTFSLRIFPYGLQNQQAGSPTRATHKNVTICGEMYPANPCACCETSHVTVYDTITTYITVADTLVIPISTGNASMPSNTLKVYPNPAYNHLVIDNGNYIVMSSYSVKITNILGQEVFTQTINQQQFNIDISTWSAGNYTLSVLDSQQNIKVSKIIVVQ